MRKLLVVTEIVVVEASQCIRADLADFVWDAEKEKGKISKENCRRNIYLNLQEN